MEVNRSKLENVEQLIRDQILVMGNEAIQALRDTALALDKLDSAQARAIVEQDIHFNERYLEIHEECLTAIARHQPVASDLREIVSDLQIAIELERIADHIASIALLASRIKAAGIPPVWSEMISMIERCADMMGKMLSACHERDTDAAAAISAADEDIDRMDDQIVREVMQFMSEHRDAVTNGTHIIWLVHHVERICDRITNIGEQVLFAKTGKLVDLNMPGSRTVS